MKRIKKRLPMIMAGVMALSLTPVQANALISRETGEFSFENNTIVNKVNNKSYSLSENSSFVPGHIGNAIQFNNSRLQIPLTDLGIDSTTQTVSVSFWFKWNGETGVMPIGFSQYDSYIQNGYFGFNTNNSDLYGMNNPFKIGEYSHVTLVFNKGDYRVNSIYINGEKQTLSQKMGGQRSVNSGFQGSLNVSGFSASNTSYLLKGSSIDELHVFKRQITDTEAQQLYRNTLSNIVSDQTTKVIGTFEATTLDVKVPALASFLYNPNTQEMTAQQMNIENDTNAPVYMQLNEIHVDTDSMWKPTLIAPTTYNDEQWNNLTEAQTKSNVALGLSATAGENWLKGLQNQHVWSTSLEDTSKLGAIKTKSSVLVNPTLKAGTSLTQEQVLTTNYIFEFGLE